MTDFEKISQAFKDAGISFVWSKKKDYISLAQDNHYDKDFEHIQNGQIIPKTYCAFECNFYFDNDGRCVDCDIR